MYNLYFTKGKTMEKLIGGQYSGCPFTHLPTGYMVWSVENGYFKKQWREIYIELQKRNGFHALGLAPEPSAENGFHTSTWYQYWDDPVQKLYISMITDGAWHWDKQQKKHKDAMRRLSKVLVNLQQLYPNENVNVSHEDFIVSDTDLGPGETEDDISMQEANDILFEHLKKEKGKTNQQVDDILNKLRTRNNSNQLELAYQNVINQLEDITRLISEQENQFTLYELRDIEWYMDTVKNRLYWILRQREDL